MLGSGRGCSCEATYATCLEQREVGGRGQVTRYCSRVCARLPLRGHRRNRRPANGGDDNEAAHVESRRGDSCGDTFAAGLGAARSQRPVLRAARRARARREVRALGGRILARRRACAGAPVKSPARRALRGSRRASRSGGASCQWRAAGPDGLRRLPPRVLRKVFGRRSPTGADSAAVRLTAGVVVPASAGVGAAAAREPEGVAPKLTLPPQPTPSGYCLS